MPFGALSEYLFYAKTAVSKEQYNVMILMSQIFSFPTKEKNVATLVGFFRTSATSRQA